MIQQLSSYLLPNSLIGIEGREMSGKTLLSLNLPISNSIFYIDLWKIEYYSLKNINPNILYYHPESYKELINILPQVEEKYIVIDSISFLSFNTKHLIHFLNFLRSLTEKKSKTIILIFNNLSDNDSIYYKKYIAKFDYFFYIKIVNNIKYYSFQNLETWRIANITSVYSSSNILNKFTVELYDNNPTLSEVFFTIDTKIKNKEIIKTNHRYFIKKTNDLLVPINFMELFYTLYHENKLIK